MTRNEVNNILAKNFSDKTFDNVLLCIQGDLDKCKTVRLEQWKATAEQQIEETSLVAKTRAEKEADKKRKALLGKMEKIYQS